METTTIPHPVATPTVAAPSPPPPAPSRSGRVLLPRSERPVGFFDLTLPELEGRLRDAGQPTYRAHQLFGWVYRLLATDYATMTDLPVALRAELAESLPLSTLTPVRELTADGGETVK